MNGISPLENTTVVVTGSTGFIGSHLVDYLVQHGCTVHALIRETSDQKWLNKSDQVKIHVVDLHQKSPIDCLQEADYLFHCAGLTKAKTENLISNQRNQCSEKISKYINHLTGNYDAAIPYYAKVEKRSLAEKVSFYLRLLWFFLQLHSQVDLHSSLYNDLLYYLLLLIKKLKLFN